MRFGGRELLLRAIAGLGAEPVWSADCRLWDPRDPANVPHLELVVRPGRELMRWPDLGSVVLFSGGQAFVYGEMFRDSVIGELGSWSPEKAAAREAALGAFWLRCDERWFRRRDRDHCPYGMLRKSLEFSDDDRVAAPADAGHIVPVSRQGRDGTAVYEVDDGVRPPRLLRKVADDERIEIRYDDHPVDWPAPPDAEVLPVEEAMARVRPARRAVKRAEPVGVEIVLLEDVWQWSVTCRNLVEVLGVANCYEAETAVRQALAAADPALLQRLEFDSEASMFAAYADNEADARALARTITALAPGT